jgi:hypothetical protein
MEVRQPRVTRGNARGAGPELRFALACLVCLSVGVTLRHGDGVNERPTVGIIRPRPAGPQFVIADLDGDRKPDLALVEMGSARSASSNYSIRLQFGAGAESAIRVNAPQGGLQVAARDVNGDDSLDLVVTSNVDGRFVEVLLNDGHGNFSVAEPGAYPEVEKEANEFLTGPAGAVTDRATLASVRSSFGEEGAPVCECRAAPTGTSIALTNEMSASRRPACSRPSRAPPAFISLS